MFSKQLLLKNKYKNFSIKKFIDLPSLPAYPLIGHTYLFLPGGKYKSEKLTEAVEDISKELGPIFKLNLGGTNIVITTDSDNARIMYQTEGKFPFRPTFPALEYYRKKNFNSIGIVPGNGQEWYKFRNGVTSLLKPQIYNIYQTQQKEIAKDFIKYIKIELNNNILNNIFDHLLKYAIEAISIISPGYRFNCFDKQNLETSEIIQASINFMDGLYATLIGPPVWKLFKNKAYRQLESAHTIVYRIIVDHLNNLKRNFDSNPAEILQKNPYMYSLFNNSNLKWSDIEMLAIELFLAGIDATATTLSMTLHYLSHNKKAQTQARLEALDVNSTRSFIKACIKESLRLSPTAGANSRFLAQDAVMSGFEIPKGTLVSVFSSITSRDDKYFINSKMYKPERWLRSSSNVYHPFASLPFGHGPRMCPGRRIAMQEMEILLQEILLNFKLEPIIDEDIGMVYRMNRVPDRKIDIKFIATNC